MPPTFTGEIRRTQSSVVAMFNNGAEQDYGKDEKDLVDDLSAKSDDEHAFLCRVALRALQSYKHENGIDIDYPNYLERNEDNAP